MAATKAKAPKEKLTLRDSADLYALVNQYIEEHIDEIELNGGALPDDLAKLMDEVDANTAARVDAFAFKIDEFTGNAAAAKATEDRAARRRRVFENIIKSMKAYALLQVQRSGGTRLEGNSAVLRIQVNGQPSTELTAPPETHDDLLLGIFDAERLRNARVEDARAHAALFTMSDIELPDDPPHPLAQFITVQRVATLDKKALAGAYLARQQELEAEIELLGDSDIPDDLRAKLGEQSTPEQLAQLLDDMRARYIADTLAAEFPGVRCVRGVHLRID